MPHSSRTQQTKTHEAAAGYSPRLCNDDLAPTRDQNWSWYNIFSFWMSDVHSMGGYVVAASFFTLGLASWQVLLCLLVGICIVQLCANLVAKPSQMAGVPYAVICRQAFGVFGANIPAVIRGLIAFAWYGIQTYLAANALMLVLLKFWPFLASLTSSSFLGLSPLGWLCFATMWLLQAMVFWHGMNAIKRFIDIAGPAVYVVMLALAGWIVYKTGLDGISFTLASKSLSAGEQTWQMITATALVVSYFSGPLLNFGDFSRYGKSMGEIRRGNRWGLPFNFLLFSVVTVVIVSGTQSLFGKMITDPIETVSRVGNDLAVAIGLLTLGMLMTNGISALQNTTVIMGLPFSFVIFFVMAGLYKSLKVEDYRRESANRDTAPRPLGLQDRLSWKKRLSRLMNYPGTRYTKQMMETVCYPAMEEVAQELRLRGAYVELKSLPPEEGQQLGHLDLLVHMGEEQNFVYQIWPQQYSVPGFTYRARSGKSTYYRLETFLLEGSQGNDLMDYSKEQVITDILDQYERHLNFIHLHREAPGNSVMFPDV